MSILAENTEQVLTESRTDHDQYVYVVVFSSNVLKVGRAKSPKNRLKQHAKDAQNHGHVITHQWVSLPHMAYRENEDALIAFCSERWTASSGKEYFTGGDFAAVVGFAQTLNFSSTPDQIIRDRAVRDAHIGQAFEKARVLREAQTAMNAITEQTDMICSIANDGNRLAASDMVFALAKKAVALTAPAWSKSTPQAAEEYLLGRGVQPEVAAERAADFELNMRTLYSLYFLAEPATFEDIAQFLSIVGGAR